MINKYPSTHASIHIFISINWVITILALSLGPISIENQRLPFNAWYPFPIDSKVILVALYTQQVIGGTFTICIASLDFIATTLIWFLAAKIELLQNDFRMISSETELKASTYKHQKLIRWLFPQVSKMLNLMFISQKNWNMNLTD